MNDEFEPFFVSSPKSIKLGLLALHFLGLWHFLELLLALLLSFVAAGL